MPYRKRSADEIKQQIAHLEQKATELVENEKRTGKVLAFCREQGFVRDDVRRALSSLPARRPGRPKVSA